MYGEGPFCRIGKANSPGELTASSPGLFAWASILKAENAALDPSPHGVVDLGPVAAVDPRESARRVRHGAVRERPDDRGAQTGGVADGAFLSSPVLTTRLMPPLTFSSS